MTTETVERPEVQEQEKTRHMPRYSLFVLNDDHHTYDYVIETMMIVFGWDQQKSFEVADTIHREGEAAVYTGSLEVAELKEEQIKSRGADYYAKKPVTFPLGTDIRAV